MTVRDGRVTTWRGTWDMAWRFVRQPDGKLALFDDVVEGFTTCDLDEDEALARCTEKGCGEGEARRKVMAGIEDHQPWKVGVPGHGLSRWDASLGTIAMRRGREGLVAVLAEVGFPDYDFAAVGIDPEALHADVADEGHAP